MTSLLCLHVLTALLPSLATATKVLAHAVA